MIYNNLLLEEEDPCDLENHLEIQERADLQFLELYNPVNQSPNSTKYTINQAQTSKSIRKKRFLKKCKSNQYSSNDQQFILKQIVQFDEDTLTNQNSNSQSPKKNDFKNVIKGISQLTLN